MFQVRGIVAQFHRWTREHALTPYSGVMEAFGVGPQKAALGLSLYVIGCKLYPAPLSGL